ncbi:hypothetical protein Patl1_24455 [Pistacia atlantica]|uniref:Uncharacterized protein n=1 Tax=Pistacia atlantica TaxID=434234 RepID=A0ACC0ZZY5_9ROSI|nr:hypothetical protein Patl1_24455 [Pistacia atlantica]
MFSVLTELYISSTGSIVSSRRTKSDGYLSFLCYLSHYLVLPLVEIITYEHVCQNAESSLGFRPDSDCPPCCLFLLLF